MTTPTSVPTTATTVPGVTLQVQPNIGQAVAAVENAFVAAVPSILPRPGWTTSELWLSVVTLATDGLEAGLHVPHALAVTVAQTALAAAYLAARTWLKGRHVQVVKP